MPMLEPASRVPAKVATPDDRAIAFERFVATHLDRSYRLARLILGRSADAEDAVQDAFVTAWRKWPSLRDPAKLEPWFGRILVNTCRDRLRRANRVRSLPLPLDLAGSDTSAALHEHDRLGRALISLPADDQVVLALRYYRDLKVDDIASILGVRPGTVMSRQHRALGRLRAILDEPGFAEDLR